jgi:hypothetical protein
MIFADAQFSHDTSRNFLLDLPFALPLSSRTWLYATKSECFRGSQEDSGN